MRLFFPVLSDFVPRRLIISSRWLGVNFGIFNLLFFWGG